MPVDPNPASALARGLAGAGAAALTSAVGLTSPLLGPFRVGSRGDGVRAVQDRLNQVLAGTPGFARLGADGVFGRKTEVAVTNFQRSRRLRPDGVVGPITAKALGFTNYTSLQRLGAGALQLASAITGSLAQLVPSPHVEPDPTHSMLALLAVHANVMRRAFSTLGSIPGAAGAVQEIDQIAAGLERKLAQARSRAAMRSIGAAIDTEFNSTQGRLLALSRQLHVLAQQQQPKTGGPSALGMFVKEQVKFIILAESMQRQMASSGPQPPQIADDLLRIAADVARAANRLLPKV